MNPFSNVTKIEERIVRSATMKNIPLGGSFELTPCCNMNCRMCYLRLSHKEMQAQGGLRSAKEWLALAREAKEAGLLFLLLTGGEPFLYPEFAYLYSELHKMGFYITINSNGTLITEEIAQLLGRFRPRRVNITLYGSSDEMYERLCQNPKGYTQTISGIKLLKDHGVDVKLNGSLTKANVDDLEKIQEIAKELELPLEVDSYMFPCSRKEVCSFEYSSRLTPAEAAEGFVKIKRAEMSEEEFQNLAKAMAECYHKKENGEVGSDLEGLPCRAGRSSFWITWQGNMTPCVFLDQPAVPVFETGFNKAWESIREEKKEIFLPSACTKCGKRPFCTVCGAAVYTETGSFKKAPEYVCEFTAEKLRLMSIAAEEN